MNISGDKKLNVKATGMIAFAVMCSRVLGLGREVLFNALFGASSMGLFLIAFRAPNLLRDLFAEGALSVSFITVFSKEIEANGDARAWDLASKMLTLTALFMSALCLVGILFAKPFIHLLAPGFSAHDLDITVLLTQWMYPFILLVSLAAIVMGMLNAKNVFGMPALASSFFNIGSILGGVVCGWLFDPQFGEKALTGLAIGTLIGGVLQLTVQWPSLSRVGFHFKLNFYWRDVGIRNILILTFPAVIAASAVQINVLINTGFASYIGKEAVTWLNSAFRLMQFPLGVLGVAVATITLPVLARIAVSVEREQFGPTIGRAIRLAIFLTLPAAVGLWFFAYPIISLIYEHGKFGLHDTLETACALQCYALGLVAYACIKVLSPAFYAIDKKWTPMLVSFVSIAINIGLNEILIFKLSLGHRGLALSTSIAATMNVVVLYACMSRWHRLEHSRLLATLLRCSVGAIVLAIFCQWLWNEPSFLMHHSVFWIRGFSLLIGIVVGGLLYLGVCFALREEAARDMVKAVYQRVSC